MPMAYAFPAICLLFRHPSCATILRHNRIAYIAIIAYIVSMPRDAFPPRIPATELMVADLPEREAILDPIVAGMRAEIVMSGQSRKNQRGEQVFLLNPLTAWTGPGA